jgi:hypothetical protein
MSIFKDLIKRVKAQLSNKELEALVMLAEAHPDEYLRLLRSVS